MPAAASSSTGSRAGRAGTWERRPGVFFCDRAESVVYRYIVDSPYTKAGLNRMSDDGRRIMYAESVARPAELAHQMHALANRDAVTVQVRKNWSNMTFDTDVTVGTYRHTGRVERVARGDRTIRCFELERVD